MTSDELAYINSLIGKRWELGAQGPDKYDCWSLARVVQERLFGHNMPIVKGAPTTPKEIIKFMQNHTCRNDWKRIDKAEHGCMVELAHYHYAFHVGVFLDIQGGGILHCHEKAGVSWDSKVSLQAVGWRKFYYYDWAN